MVECLISKLINVDSEVLVLPEDKPNAVEGDIEFLDECVSCGKCPLQLKRGFGWYREDIYVRHRPLLHITLYFQRTSHESCGDGFAI